MEQELKFLKRRVEQLTEQLALMKKTSGLTLNSQPERKTESRKVNISGEEYKEIIELLLAEKEKETSSRSSKSKNTKSKLSQDNLTDILAFQESKIKALQNELIPVSLEEATKKDKPLEAEKKVKKILKRMKEKEEAAEKFKSTIVKAWDKEREMRNKAASIGVEGAFGKNTPPSRARSSLGQSHAPSSEQRKSLKKLSSSMMRKSTAKLKPLKNPVL